MFKWLDFDHVGYQNRCVHSIWGCGYSDIIKSPTSSLEWLDFNHSRLSNPLQGLLVHMEQGSGQYHELPDK